MVINACDICVCVCVRMCVYRYIYGYISFHFLLIIILITAAAGSEFRSLLFFYSYRVAEIRMSRTMKFIIIVRYNDGITLV